MMKWAILSGIEGNLTAYEAVMTDIKRQSRYIEALYILGDVVGPTPESEKLVELLHNSHNSESGLSPLVCKGWWEEQSLILHGLSATSEPTDLLQKYGGETVKLLWDNVSRHTVEWIRNLDFGFFELDALLIHGTTVSVDEALTPETSPVIILDRVARMQANNLFCGRSGLTFQYNLEAGSINTGITTLDSQVPNHTINVTPRMVVGVGNVGRKPGEATYTLYNPNNNQVEFKTVYYGVSKGFAMKKTTANSN
ncbi:MAG: metallophosphatase [Richelia sp. RM2_1_2]|nr:metallophosphatase [Richelia sp. SM2_1_7]NJM22484.1 metallophosphatase [Richelia sp. SM1_7_0]NJN09025.1 metallophosphatase [Richelia sp. RM1_1_1]NJO27075.1 metallophosphatase [Richelia sp. SL_2_1]NJO57181.1 metallophosphatase [Richelia sp. RM2_1_2]